MTLKYWEKPILRNSYAKRRSIEYFEAQFEVRTIPDLKLKLFFETQYLIGQLRF